MVRGANPLRTARLVAVWASDLAGAARFRQNRTTNRLALDGILKNLPLLITVPSERATFLRHAKPPHFVPERRPGYAEQVSSLAKLSFGLPKGFLDLKSLGPFSCFGEASNPVGRRGQQVLLRKQRLRR